MTKHLTPEQLVDLADGTVAEAAFPHLAACEACRRQLSELRSTLNAVGNVVDAVPEPSPFFWNQFQRQVSEQIAREAESSAFARIRSILRPRILVPIAAGAALAIATVIVNLDRGALPPIPTSPESSAASASIDGGPSPSSRFELLNDAFDDDPSLQLVAELASSLDPADASDAGLAPRGSAEHALAHMTPQELQELHRLLRAELGT